MFYLLSLYISSHITNLSFYARSDQDWDSFDQKMRKNKQTNKRNKEEKTLEELEKRDIFYFCWWLVKLKVTWIIPRSCFYRKRTQMISGSYQKNPKNK